MTRTKNKILLLKIVLLFIISINTSFAKNYYVSGTGNDGNNGLSTSAPFLTLQKASDLSNPGDTVFVMNGTYTNSFCSTCSVVDITHSGSSAAWIVYMAYPGQYPKLQYNGWSGFNVDASSYIQIIGFEVVGNNANMDSVTAYGQKNNGNNPLTSGNGITIQPQGTTYPHHILIKNNSVHDWGGGGISSQNADYITIEGNRVYNNSWYSCYDPSGISIGWCSNFDQDSSIYKIIVRGNICYNNKNEIPDLYGGGISDGEGIIIDVQDGTAGGVPAYTGHMILENNICFGNGGDGITLFKTNHVDVINNTCYLNDKSSAVNRGQIAPNQGKNTRILNNILYSLPGKAINLNCCPNTNLTVNYNVYWSSSGSPSASLIAASGINDKKADPKFINASTNPATANFHLTATSPAIGSGTSFLAPTIDFDGNPRPSGTGFDIGAYQTVIATAILNQENTSTLLIYPNPTGDHFFVETNENQKQLLEVFDVMGKLIVSQIIQVGKTSIDVTNLVNGIYNVVVTGNEQKTNRRLVIVK